MRARTRERVRLALIGSTVVAAALTVLLGVPRARAWMTPRLERVWVVSAALGDSVASVEPTHVEQGAPVTLFAIIEARPRFGSESVLYGTVDSVQLTPGEEPRAVEAWSDWWYVPEILWFKVEPTYPFDNEGFDESYAPASISYSDQYQVAWGFDWSHAADVSAGGDAFPELETGTMRFSARAVVRDDQERILQQATGFGAGQVHEPATERAPNRVTVHGGDDPIGRLQGYAGLPYVPIVHDVPPERHPATRYLGGTVLDFWLAAHRELGLYRGPMVGWERLDEIADLVVDDMFLGNDGQFYLTSDPRRTIGYDRVRPGDILAIDDHVGILYEDRGPGGAGNGELDRWDRVLDAYFEPLGNVLLGDAFVADVSVWRLRTEPGDE